jgi:hypothetical protein
MTSFADIVKVISRTTISIKIMLFAFFIILLFFYYILFFITIPSGNFIEIIKLLLINMSLTAIPIICLIEDAQKKSNLIKK